MTEEKKDMINGEETKIEEPKNQDQQQETKPAEGEKKEGFFEQIGSVIQKGLPKAGKWLWNGFAILGMTVTICEGVHYIADKRSKSLLDQIDSDSTASAMGALHDIEI